MVDPISLAAITTMLGAVGAGMANEAGKRAYELVGGLARRMVGREVPAPSTAADWEGLARLLHDGARRDGAHARSLAQVEVVIRGALPRAGTQGVPQLPPSVRFFVNRQKEMRSLWREHSRKPDGRPRRALVYGAEGMGASALAVQWGWQQAGKFPDGQLYVDLRGDGAGRGVDAAVAVRRALRQLGVPEGDIPPGPAERTALFRGLVADRHLLIVLDHAQSAAQVGPLFTSAPGVFTIVVAHRLLTGVDAVPVEVGPLGKKHAVELLEDIAGSRTVKADRPRLTSVLDRCGGSPYALRAIAPRLAEQPVGEEPTGVSADHFASSPAFSVVEDLYRALSPELARVYRLSALWPWSDVTAALAAAAAGIPEDEAAGPIAELADRGLLEATEAGRYRFRPAVRRHAEQTAAREDGVAACARAVERTVGSLLRFAAQADLDALPQRWHVGPVYDELSRGAYAHSGEAVAALDAELGNLAQAVLAAEEFGLGGLACQLCEALWALQLKAGRHEELLPALRAGARVADQVCPGSRMAARMHTQLALACTELRQYDEAEAELTLAAAVERGLGHLRGQATNTETLGLVRLAQWQFDEALRLFTTAAGFLEGITPDDDGFADVPRARALLQRHRGRALRGLGRWTEAEDHLRTALRFFRDHQEAYNTARTLTDLAETFLLADRRSEALPLIDEATAKLSRENARYHLVHLGSLRQSCVSDAGEPGEADPAGSADRGA